MLIINNGSVEGSLLLCRRFMHGLYYTQFCITDKNKSLKQLWMSGLKKKKKSTKRHRFMKVSRCNCNPAKFEVIPKVT